MSKNIVIVTPGSTASGGSLYLSTGPERLDLS